MKTEEEWKAEAKRIVRAEMTRRGVTYERLVALLKELGIDESVPNLKNKVSRGKFDFTLVLKCMVAMGVKKLTVVIE